VVSYWEIQHLVQNFDLQVALTSVLWVQFATFLEIGRIPFIKMRKNILQCFAFEGSNANSAEHFVHFFEVANASHFGQNAARPT
jgi:hypothetical protein